MFVFRITNNVFVTQCINNILIKRMMSFICILLHKTVRYVTQCGEDYNLKFYFKEFYVVPLIIFM